MFRLKLWTAVLGINVPKIKYKVVVNKVKNQNVLNGRTDFYSYSIEL